MREKTVITREQHDSAKEKEAARRLIVELLGKCDGDSSDDDFVSFLKVEWVPRARFLIDSWGTYKRRVR